MSLILLLYLLFAAQVNLSAIWKDLNSVLWSQKMPGKLLWIQLCNKFLIFLIELVACLIFRKFVKIAQIFLSLLHNSWLLSLNNCSSPIGSLCDLVKPSLLFLLSFVGLQNLQSVQFCVAFHRLHKAAAPAFEITFVFETDLDYLVGGVLYLEEIVAGGTLTSVQFTGAQINKVTRCCVTLCLFVAKDTFFDLCVSDDPMRFALQGDHAFNRLSLYALIWIWRWIGELVGSYRVNGASGW